MKALADNDIVTLFSLLILDPEAIAGFSIFTNALIAQVDEIRSPESDLALSEIQKRVDFTVNYQIK